VLHMEGRSKMPPEKIEIYAANRTDGSPVFEEIVVEKIGDSEYLLLKSPGLVIGMAAGDTFRLLENSRFEIVTRGKNVCVQIFYPAEPINLEKEATSLVVSLGGRLDGRSRKQLVYTIPVSAGFKKIEQVLNLLTDKFAGIEWYYSNVYDEKDGITPLNWWL
jgi:hypothetical protein